MSQSELARRSGLTSAAISKIEKGGTEPTIDTLKKLADALKVGLIFLTEESKPLNETGKDILYREFGDIMLLSLADQKLIKTIVSRLMKRINKHGFN